MGLVIVQKSLGAVASSKGSTDKVGCTRQTIKNVVTGEK